MTSTLQKTIVEWGRSAAALVYPPACVRCDAPLPDVIFADDKSPRSRRRFCGNCHELLRCRIDHACLTCGAPVGPHLETWGCRHCRNDRFAFERVVALGVYEQPLMQACQQAKEPHEEPLTAGLTELLFEAHEATLGGADIDVIVPVPHHWWERATGCPQPPMTMAGVLSRRLSIPTSPHILAKRRRTPTQALLPPEQRRTNLKEAFGIIGRQRLDGVSVLLTDDVLTTGTTADRASRVLRQAGADRILVAVLARGIGQSSTV